MTLQITTSDSYEGLGGQVHDLEVPAFAQEMRPPTVSLVIPAKNEARNLPFVLENLPDCLDEVILVDGNSRDVSVAAARACRSDIRIVTDAAPGKGNALRAGFAAANGDLIVAMDADGSMDPAEIPRFLYFLENGFDFVKGSRFVGGGGSLDITQLRKLGNRGLLAAASVLFDFDSPFTDLCYGFFAFKRCYLDHLDLHCSGFEIETELTIRAYVTGLRIVEVPSLELPRRSGRSNLHAVRDGMRVMRTLLCERQRLHNGAPSLPLALPPGPPIELGPSASSPDRRCHDCGQRSAGAPSGST